MKSIFISFSIIGALFLGACGTTGAERALVVSQCPVLKNYSQSELQQAAAELRGIPDSKVATLITDYGQLRDACRVASKKLKSIRKKNRSVRR